MPKKTNFQFYATHGDIQRFIDHVISANEVHVYLVRLFPEYAMLEIIPGQAYELRQWTLAVFSECRREIDTMEAYSIYSHTIHDDLTMHIGEETETELRESFICSAAENAVNPVWLKLIRILKKSCLKGAYVVTPQNSRQYYPHIAYSEGAQAAWRNGKAIRPVIGWNRVELISE